MGIAQSQVKCELRNYLILLCYEIPRVIDHEKFEGINSFRPRHVDAVFCVVFIMLVAQGRAIGSVITRLRLAE
jgi:hypothetical protein